MKYLPLIALLWLFLPAVNGAEALGFEFARMDLLDGRTLKAVTITSYDPSSDRLLLLAEGKLMLVPTKLVPPPFAEHFRKNAKRSGGSTSTVPSASSASSSKPTTSTTRTQNRRNTIKGKTIQESSENAADPKPAHLEAARKRAERFYRYEFTAGSNSITVTAQDIEITHCDAVAGWTGRYRSEGTARLEYFDSKGNGFQRVSSKFEILTESSEESTVAVIDFTRK